MAGKPYRKGRLPKKADGKQAPPTPADRLRTHTHLPIPGTDPFAKTFETKTRRVADIAAELGISPETTLLLIADGNSEALGYSAKFKIPVECRLKASSDLMTFMHPRVQAIAITHLPEGGIDKAMRMQPEERQRRIRELTTIVQGSDLVLNGNGKANGHDET